jgi:hypothetical protein
MNSGNGMFARLGTAFVIVEKGFKLVLCSAIAKILRSFIRENQIRHALAILATFPDRLASSTS